jgi:hypothetical protein
MNIYWDYAEHKLVKDLAGTQQITELTWILRDIIPVTLYVVTPAGSGSNYYQATDAPAGCAPVFGAKASSGLAGAHLVYQPTWSKSGSGATAKYAANVSLATQELIDAVGSAASLEIVGEFTMLDASGNNRDSTQFTLYVKPDVTRGTETVLGGVYAPVLLKEETIGGKKYLIFCNSDGVEYERIGPPGA